MRLKALAAVVLAVQAVNTGAVYAEPRTEAVYSEGQVYESTRDGKQLQYTTHQQPGDDLVLSSGAVVASDAFYIFGMQPLDRALEPGQYHVILTVTKDTEGDVRVAYARIEVAPGEPVRWEPAATFAVQSGTAVFLDHAALQGAAQNYDPYGNAVLGALTYAVEHDEYWTSVTVDQDTGDDAVVFTSGYGDGSYTTYWGLDENDQPVALVADFNVLTP